ncbi:MAG: hypothetical protein HY254_08670 [Burkholderiales bacterium]|nr:hypothetical protein [Burkholderiales bacterium]
MVTLGVACPADYLPQALWLSNESLGYLRRSQAFLFVDLPETWQLRVKKSLADSDQRNKSFFKQQGEKAQKALQAQPTATKP